MVTQKNPAFVAVVEDATRCLGSSPALLQQIREDNTVIIGILAGDFTSGSLAAQPAGRPRSVRAAEAIAAGCDIVLGLPTIALTNGPDTAAFAAVSLMQRLHCLDRVVIPYHDAVLPADVQDMQKSGSTAQILDKAAMQLFMETPGFQKIYKGLQQKAAASDGTDPQDLLLAAADQLVPGTLALAADPLNRAAIQLLTQVHKLYNPVRPVLIAIDPSSGASGSETQTTPETTREYSPLIGKSFSLPELREHLQIEFKDNSISMLYTHCPYIRVLAIREDAKQYLPYLSEHAWAGLTSDDPAIGLPDITRADAYRADAAHADGSQADDLRVDSSSAADGSSEVIRILARIDSRARDFHASLR